MGLNCHSSEQLEIKRELATLALTAHISGSYTIESQYPDYQVSQAAELIANAQKLVVFTGAGISTESGIPDFRGPNGIWSRYNPEDFTFHKFIADPKTRYKIWKMLTESGLTIDAQPNQAHHAVAELEKLGKLDCIITQNIDNLHQKAGNSPEKIYELHGNMQQSICLSCHELFPTKDILKQLTDKTEPPECPHCQGIVKPHAVFFGESLPEKTLRDAIHHARHCDLFVVIGSTLFVYPAAFVPMYAKEAGARLIIINLGATAFDHEATILINGKAGKIMTRIIEKVREKLSEDKK